MLRVRRVPPREPRPVRRIAMPTPCIDDNTWQICEHFAEDVMPAEAIPRGRSIFVNPPYGQRK